jgi:HAMP domain-containing protein
VDGRLGGQANVPGAAGTWKDLTGNVNLLAANLTTQVRAIAEVATAVTKGDLTRSIQVETRGEVAELKDNINTMISNLRETTESNREQDWLRPTSPGLPACSGPARTQHRGQIAAGRAGAAGQRHQGTIYHLTEVEASGLKRWPATPGGEVRSGTVPWGRHGGSMRHRKSARQHVASDFIRFPPAWARRGSRHCCAAGAVRGIPRRSSSWPHWKPSVPDRWPFWICSP